MKKINYKISSLFKNKFNADCKLASWKDAVQMGNKDSNLS